MNDQPVTLTNVFIGIHKHDLINILTPGCFTFYTGLILCANSLYFKNPIGMSSKQAMAAGGGDSRQTVYARRKTLCKIRIDREPILKCDPGSHAKNSVALYEINYNLLCRYNGVWSESTGVMLNESYSKPTDSLQIANGNATILRSDQKRLEEKASDAEGDSLAKLMQDKWPHPNPPNHATVERMIKKFGLSVCVDAMDTTPSDMVNSKWNSIYNYMRKVAEDLIPDEVPEVIPAEDKAIHWFRQAVMDYKAIDPDTGLSPGQNRAGFLINSIRPYRKWYDTIDNLGDIVGMQLDEYEALMNGGAK